jgi:hypothetical protein
MPADAQLRERLASEVREVAEGIGVEAKDLSLFPGLNNLPLIMRVAELHKIQLDAAITAVLQRAAESLTGFEGDRPRVARSEIALCALGMGSYVGIPGLHARLRALGRQKQLQLSTMRGYWRNVAKMLAQQLLNLNPDEITPRGLAQAVGDWEYTSVRTQVLYLMEGRRPRSVITTRELRAVRSDLRSYGFPVGYPRDIREGVIEVRALANCAVESSVLGGLGEQYTVVNLPKTPVGETVRFMYEIAVNSDVDDLPFLRHRGRVPGGPFLFEIQFDLEEVPSIIWHFAERPLDYDPTVTPDHDRLVKLSSLGFGSIEFAREVPDRALGIAWQWL